MFPAVPAFMIAGTVQDQHPLGTADPGLAPSLDRTSSAP